MSGSGKASETGMMPFLIASSRLRYSKTLSEISTSLAAYAIPPS
jgi:hypothetical protein